jgi:hypothetical protein
MNGANFTVKVSIRNLKRNGKKGGNPAKLSNMKNKNGANSVTENNKFKFFKLLSIFNLVVRSNKIKNDIDIK